VWAVGVLVLEDAQALHDALRDAGEAAALVDVRDVDRRRLRGRPYAVGDQARALAGLERVGLEAVRAGDLLDEQHVVEDVDVVDAPAGPVPRLEGDEEPALVEGEGHEEARPRPVDELVAGDGLDLPAPPGDALDRAVGLVAALRRVEEDELAHPPHTMMAGDDGDELGRAPRDGARVEDGVRPVGVAAVELHLVRPVGVHVHEDPAEVVRGVGVLPAREEYPPVVEHGRVPVVVLVVAETPDAPPVALRDVDVPDVVRSANARDGVPGAVRDEEDPFVGEVARVVAVQVRDDLAEAPSVEADLAHAAVRREDHLLRVPVQVDLADVGLVRRPEDRLRRGARVPDVERHHLVVELALVEAVVALPVRGQADVPAPSDEEQLLEVDGRMVVDEDFPLEGEELLGLGGVAAALDGRLHAGDPRA
jgi:hypothetical protein